MIATIVTATIDTTAVLIGLVALATSALTAVLGFGGGIVLLAALLLMVDPLVAVALHAGIQVVSNGTRVVIRRRDVDWSIVGWSSLLLLPAGALILPLAQRAPANAVQAVMAVGLLAVTWIPERRQRPLPAPSPAGWVALGAGIGALNPVVGATGPLAAPFYRAATDTRQRFVGTFAGSQVAGHLVKVVLFGLAGLAPVEHLPRVVMGIIGVTVGTHLGSLALDRVSEARFRSIYLTAITAVAVQLLVSSLLDLR